LYLVITAYAHDLNRGLVMGRIINLNAGDW
jgi:hypothetical protein